MLKRIAKELPAYVHETAEQSFRRGFDKNNSQGRISPLQNTQNKEKNSTGEYSSQKNLGKQQARNLSNEKTTFDNDLLAKTSLKLDKLERKLAKKSRKKTQDTLGTIESAEKNQDIRNMVMAELNLRKIKKNKKNWRFAYDMYCKELISGKDQVPVMTSQGNLSQRATITQQITSDYRNNKGAISTRGASPDKSRCNVEKMAQTLNSSANSNQRLNQNPLPPQLMN